METTAKETAANVARGALFGAALTLSGVYLPSVIVGQLALRDFHMLQAFLTASATSALVLAFSREAGKPKPASHLGRIGPYDGNIIGGAMVGIGMALTGACPGTIFVQFATGIPSAFPILLGGLAGGIIFVKIENGLKGADVGTITPDEPPPTIASRLHMDPMSAVLAYNGLLGSVILAASRFRPHSPRLLNPVLGGLGIGVAQLASALLVGEAIGVSTAYEEAGKWTWWWVKRLTGKDVDKNSARPSTKKLTFAASIVLGAWLLSKIHPESILRDDMPISSLRGFVGGLVMILGARVAGGCTSGHGISGMSVLSVSSLYTVAAMFAGGIALTQVLQA